MAVERRKQRTIDRAPLNVQRAFRGWQGRRVAAERRRVKQERQEAALMLQRIFRGWLGRQWAGEVKWLGLQCAMDMRHVKQMMMEEEQEEQDEGAVELQRIARGWLGRRRMVARREEVERQRVEEAAREAERAEQRERRREQERQRQERAREEVVTVRKKLERKLAKENNQREVSLVCLRVCGFCFVGMCLLDC